MSLPSVAVPEETITLLSIKQPVTIRPYLVGEEKLLLMAQQTDTPAEIEKAIKQIIRRCTFEKVDPDTLAFFDLAYVFLQLRAISVNNIIEAYFRCRNPKDGKECDALTPVKIDIKDIKLTVPDGHTNRVMLTDDLGVTLKYPTAATYESLSADASNIVDVLPATLDTIFDVKTGAVFEVKEQTPDEVRTFVEGLTLLHVGKIREQFFDTMPRLEHTFDFKCVKCGYTTTITLSELSDFFD